jgi:pimeloyl-ACP methyl ester carboxylesterase
MLPKMLSPKSYIEKPELVSLVKEIMETSSVDGISGALLGMKDRSDSTEILTGFNIPTLIIHGSDDQLVPLAEAESMAKAIPNSKFQVIPNAGHLPNMEQPDQFNNIMSTFLKDL